MEMVVVGCFNGDGDGYEGGSGGDFSGVVCWGLHTLVALVFCGACGFGLGDGGDGGDGGWWWQ
ncbi:hypothetical protein BVRB_8g193790 [Beta vulgaris subsp. vulgaris]|nr:hypothetical protein BVRB_8g193790 [Beta vulgaris subsp. vulgaris]